MTVALTMLTTTGATGATRPFRASVDRLSATERAGMTPSVWRPGCPVSLGSLRALRVSHIDFRGRLRTGTIVVHRDVAGEVVDVMRRLYVARVPIRRMVPIERFGGSDFRSIEADNTTAFNCRFVDGTRRWSEHASGRAIDINPIENPYVSGGRTSHRASIPYVRRSPARPGMATNGAALVRAFDAVGWGWGGRWRGVKDFQHFSESGR